jgi:hypothetical protein
MVIPAKPWGLTCALTALASVLAVATIEALSIFDGWHEDDQDAERALRIRREYDVPDEAVAPATGRRARRDLPEIESNYKNVGVR